MIADNFRMAGDFEWAEGDFDWDGKVSLGDLGILAANFGPFGPIPEAEFEEAVERLFGVPILSSFPSRQARCS